jgi:DGQHR domain-containing protein
MATPLVRRTRPVPGDDDDRHKLGDEVSYAARLIVQGTHRFYTLAMPSDVLGASCVVDTREGNPETGFQRMLDAKRAQEIADYIDTGFGTVPSSIVLSAQPKAGLVYQSRSQVLSFKYVPGAFLILDGQHRVFGFQKARSRIKVPVVIYNGLSRSDEARLFIDINTKQRPVPNELLLDIKRMADTETDVEALNKNVFDRFEKDPSSPLAGLMSPSSRSKGKISRVTFNAALQAVSNALRDADADYVYEVLSAYLHAWVPFLRQHGDFGKVITNSTLFRAIVILFPLVAERVSDRHGNELSVENFVEVLRPLFSRIKPSVIKTPGSSPIALSDAFKKQLQSGFSLGGTRS